MRPRAHRNRRRAASLAAALLAALAVSACTIHAHQAPPRRATAVRVTVAAGHVHTARCGHYRHRGHWYHLRGHVHRHGCGHALVAGTWVVRR